MTKQTKIIIAILVVVVASWFYWYELRPASFRRECSWVKVVDEAKPEIPRVTKEDVRAKEKEREECEKNAEVSGKNLFGEYSERSKASQKYLACSHIIVHEHDGAPAKPESEWYREAKEKEYDKCLHQKGLQ